MPAQVNTSSTPSVYHIHIPLDDAHNLHGRGLIHMSGQVLPIMTPRFMRIAMWAACSSSLVEMAARIASPASSVSGRSMLVRIPPQQAPGRKGAFLTSFSGKSFALAGLCLETRRLLTVGGVTDSNHKKYIAELGEKIDGKLLKSPSISSHLSCFFSSRYFFISFRKPQIMIIIINPIGNADMILTL